MENKNVIKLTVSSGNRTPYYYSNDGTKIAYIRIGNQSVISPVHTLNELILKGTGASFDSEISKETIHDLSFTLLKATYKKRSNKEFNETTDYISFGLANKFGKVSNAGILFSDQCPLLQSRIFCTRWQGITMTTIQDEAVDDKEFSGNLIYLLQSGLDFIKLHNKKAWHKTSKGRVEKPDYEEDAIFEILVNSLIHRQYSIIGSEVHIDMFDDRLEITSPGGMFDGSLIQEQDLLNIISSRRNPIIADMFQRLNFMERRGSGIKKVFNSIVDKDKIQFYSDRNFFKVTFYNLNYSNGSLNDSLNDSLNGSLKLTELQHKILMAIEKNQYISRKELAENHSISIRTLDRAINDLKNLDILKRIGSKKNGYWKINKLNSY